MSPTDPTDRPTSEWNPATARSFARRLGWAVALVPLLLGGLQLAGLRTGLWGPEAGAALNAIACVLVMGGLTAYGMSRLSRLETRHRMVLDALHVCEHRVREVVLQDQASQSVNAMNAMAHTVASKQAEREARRLNEVLEARVAQRTEELAKANKELDDFAHSVSHDLRAPLRAISGFGQFLTTEYAPAFDDRGRGYLRRMVEAAAGMDALIADLLQYARASRAELRSRPVDLGALAHDITRELQRAEPARRVDFICPSGLHAHGDVRLLNVALMNLLDNAWKYTGKTVEPRVEFGRSGVNGETTFFIRDNGVGFDPRYAHRLFGAFQRLHSAAEFEGNGIGLATVQRIIHRHGGKVWAEAKLNEGATFFFTLPDRTAALAESVLPMPAREPAASTPFPLAVDVPATSLRPEPPVCPPNPGLP